MKTGQSRGSGLFCLNLEHTHNETRTFLRSTSTIFLGDMVALALKRPRASAVEAEAQRSKEPGPGLARWRGFGKLSEDGPTENHQPPPASCCIGPTPQTVMMQAAPSESRAQAWQVRRGWGSRGGKAGPRQGVGSGDGKRRKNYSSCQLWTSHVASAGPSPDHL